MSLFEIVKVINSIALVFLGGWFVFRKKSGSYTVLSVMAAAVLIVSLVFNATTVGIESYSSWKERNGGSANSQDLEAGFAGNLKKAVDEFFSFHQDGIRNLVSLAFTLRSENINKLQHRKYAGDVLVDSDGTYLSVLKKEYEAILVLSESLESLKSTYAKGLDKETYHFLIEMSDWIKVLEKTVLSILKYNEIERRTLLVRLGAEPSDSAKSNIAKEYLARLQKPREQFWSTAIPYTKGIIGFYNKILETLSAETRSAYHLTRLDEEAVLKNITDYIRDVSAN